jgi:uncharacterized protein (UPF0261 family)
MQVRTTAEELKWIAKTVAKKLNKYRGLIKFFIPLRGWSSISTEGTSLFEPETDIIFNESLRKHLRAGIEVIEQDDTYDSLAFAEKLVISLEDLLAAK